LTGAEPICALLQAGRSSCRLVFSAPGPRPAGNIQETWTVPVQSSIGYFEVVLRHE
jgi:hypothetical protein